VFSFLIDSQTFLHHTVGAKYRAVSSSCVPYILQKHKIDFFLLFLSSRILGLKTADDFYSVMGVVTREMLENGLMDPNSLVKVCLSFLL
jgi:hypothetical protein